MKRFLILSIFTTLILSIPAGASQTSVSKQSEKLTVAVINAPPDQVPAVPNTQIPTPAASQGSIASSTEYTIGIGDVLDVHVLKPETIYNSVTVAPDGTIVFPYIGSVMVRNHTIAQIQDEIQSRLANGYMKYPVISVSLAETNSRRFFVYGEVARPGAYNMEENMSVLRAISMAGGFSQFGSSSRVKILRPKKRYHRV